MLRGITIAGRGVSSTPPPPYFNSAHGYFSFDFLRDNIFIELALFIIRIVAVRREDMIEGLPSILALKGSYEAVY